MGRYSATTGPLYSAVTGPLDSRFWASIGPVMAQYRQIIRTLACTMYWQHVMGQYSPSTGCRCTVLPVPAITNPMLARYRHVDWGDTDCARLRGSVNVLFTIQIPINTTMIYINNFQISSTRNICIWYCFSCGMRFYRHESPNPARVAKRRGRDLVTSDGKTHTARRTVPCAFSRTLR